MKCANRWRFVIFISLLYLTVVPATEAAANNATIINGNVHLRSSYPGYGTSTLYKFQLVPGESLLVIPQNSRVEVSARQVIGNQEWFKTAYSVNHRVYHGWVYGGNVGSRRYVRLDPGVQVSLRNVTPASQSTSKAMQTKLMEVFLAKLAHAEELPIAVKEPALPTNPFNTLSFIALNVALFIFGLIAIRKWVFPGSDKHVCAMSLPLLLIQEYVSKEMFGELLTRWLAGNF